MDIKSAENSANKILDYINSVKNSEASLYSKSKQRLHNIADMCSQVVKAVSDILQEEVLQSDSVEFENQSDSGIYEQVEALSREINRLKEFVSMPKSYDVSTTVAEPLCGIKSEIIADSESSDANVGQSCEDCDGSNADVPDNTKLSPSDKKEVISKYGAILKRSSTTSTGYSVVDGCSEMIWQWFQNRIFKKYANAPPFHYGLHRIKSIIGAFVIMYGYHVENDSLDKFIRYFEDWLESLSTSNESNRWIAPYQIYQLERKLDSKYANLTSVVIWDILIDSVYSDLNRPENPNYLSDTYLWDLIENCDDSVLDNYENYQVNPAILESLKLV